VAKTAVLVAITAALLACSDAPSKSDALEAIQRDVKEEAGCTLPISLLSRLKMQHSTKAVCVARDGGAPNDSAMACLDALVAAGATKRMPGSYMAEWPDEISGAGFDSVSPYERRARELVFRGCVEMVGALRDGQFRCGQARADKIVRITKKDETHALVRYARALTLDPQLAAIDAACGAVSRPAAEETVVFEKTDKHWAISSESPSATGSTSAR
jgi:hypothetical protein